MERGVMVFRGEDWSGVEKERGTIVEWTKEEQRCRAQMRGGIDKSQAAVKEKSQMIVTVIKEPECE